MNPDVSRRRLDPLETSGGRPYTWGRPPRLSFLRDIITRRKSGIQKQMNDSVEPLHVIIVDDDPLVRRALARLFRLADYDVTSCESASELLNLELERPAGPTCLVLDVHMPRVTGLDLLDELNRRGITIPVIFLTGFGDVPSSVRAMKGGAVEFLEKPYDEDELLAAVARALELHRRTLLDENAIREVQQRVDSLSPREREVLEHVITGRLNKQVAARLGISEKTVKVHRARVMEKMNVRSVAELVRAAAKVGITGPSQ